MPVRSLNYTGRKRITSEEVAITLREEPAGYVVFDADIRLRENHMFPADAAVHVEAYRGSTATWMRFDFGTVKSLVPQPDRRLQDFDSADGILFRVKITSVEEKHGLLLGEADRIRPRSAGEEEPSRQAILPVYPDKNLGQRIYRVNFDGQSQPVLLINSSLGDWRDVVRTPAFFALALPTVFETILMRILRVERYRDDPGDEESAQNWQHQWLRFARSFPGVGQLPDVQDDEAVDEWIDSVIQAFCRKHRIFDRFEEDWNRSNA